MLEARCMSLMPRYGSNLFCFMCIVVTLSYWDGVLCAFYALNSFWTPIGDSMPYPKIACYFLAAEKPYVEDNVYQVY